MRKVVVSLGTLVLLVCWSAPWANAGAIRYAGKKIGNGTAALADGATSAGKKTSSAVASGATAVGKGLKATPGAVADGTKAVAKGIAKAIW